MLLLLCVPCFFWALATLARRTREEEEGGGDEVKGVVAGRLPVPPHHPPSDEM